jgi:predicted translin family RNA/ssDNA-binding protein
MGRYIRTNTTELKREYFENLYSNKVENLREMENFLEHVTYRNCTSSEYKKYKKTKTYQ